jgi:HPt (histidine-containing phosphotransfer) domain-containing protein
VALTAGALVGERQRSLEAGMNDFVTKPFDPRVLIRKVRRLVEKARGAPVPLVVLDNAPASHSNGGALIASIDAGVVQQMFGADMPLFRSLLARLLREYAELALPVVISPGDKSIRIHLRALTHKLKGSAGMVGANRVMQLAGAAEEALEGSHSLEVIQGILTQLAIALAALREESAALPEIQPEQAAGTRQSGANSHSLGTEEIAELSSLLESQNLAAIEKFHLLSMPLSEMLSAARFERLHTAIDELEFERAAELLRDALHHQSPQSKRELVVQ